MGYCYLVLNVIFLISFFIIVFYLCCFSFISLLLIYYIFYSLSLHPPINYFPYLLLKGKQPTCSLITYLHRFGFLFHFSFSTTSLITSKFYNLSLFFLLSRSLFFHLNPRQTQQVIDKVSIYLKHSSFLATSFFSYRTIYTLSVESTFLFSLFPQVSTNHGIFFFSKYKKEESSLSWSSHTCNFLRSTIVLKTVILPQMPNNYSQYFLKEVKPTFPYDAVASLFSSAHSFSFILIPEILLKSTVKQHRWVIIQNIYGIRTVFPP